jgi:BolA protein
MNKEVEMIKNEIETLLTQAFSPTHLRVVDQSHLHAGHAESPGKDSHFKIEMTAAAFENITRLQCHRMVKQAILQKFPDIHAITLSLKTP